MNPLEQAKSNVAIAPESPWQSREETLNIMKNLMRDLDEEIAVSTHRHDAVDRTEPIAQLAASST